MLVRMADPERAETIRAVVEVLLPPSEGRAGALDVDADEHAVDQLDKYLPGFPDMAAALFDAYAGGVRPGASFKELSVDERVKALGEMAADESQDIREALDAVTVFAIGGAYSEWPARHEDPPRPRTWDDTGYPGPSDGYPEYREGI
jgi:hypothetical protein